MIINFKTWNLKAMVFVNAIPALANAILTVSLVSIFDPRLVGVWFMIRSFAQIGNAITPGFNLALLIVPHKKISREDVVVSFSLTLLWNLFATLFAIVLLGFMTNEPDLYWVGVVFWVALAIYNMSSVALRIDGNMSLMRWSAISDFVQSSIILVVVLSTPITLPQTVLLLSARFLLKSVFGIYCAAGMIRFYPSNGSPMFKLDRVYELLLNGFGIAFKGLNQVVVQFGDKLILGAILPALKIASIGTITAFILPVALVGSSVYAWMLPQLRDNSRKSASEIKNVFLYFGLISSFYPLILALLLPSYLHDDSAFFIFSAANFNLQLIIFSLVTSFFFSRLSTSIISLLCFAFLFIEYLSLYFVSKYIDIECVLFIFSCLTSVINSILHSRAFGWRYSIFGPITTFSGLAVL